MKIKMVTGKKTGKQIVVIVLHEAEYADAQENSTGYCLGCGVEADGCEPDARQYPCGACGERRVYGAEECLMMGRIEIVGDDGDAEVSA